MAKQSNIDRMGRSYVQRLSDLIACLADDRLTRLSTDPETGLILDTTYAPHREGLTYIAAVRTPVPLRFRDGGPLRLSLNIQHGYRVIRCSDDAGEPIASRRSSILTDWRIETTFYEYRVLGRMETELLVVHDHPGPEHLGPDHPHLRVSATMFDQAPNGDAIPYDLDKRHVVTGMVTLAAVARMLIEEFGAEGRGDWQRILAAAGA